MVVETKINTSYCKDCNDPFEISIRGNAENSLDIVSKTIEILIQSIDVRHSCKEDYELYQTTLSKILLVLAENLIEEGWKSHLHVDSHQRVSEKQKIRVLYEFLYELSKDLMEGKQFEDECIPLGS